MPHDHSHPDFPDEPFAELRDALNALEVCLLISDSAPDEAARRAVVRLQRWQDSVLAGRRPAALARAEAESVAVQVRRLERLAAQGLQTLTELTGTGYGPDGRYRP